MRAGGEAGRDSDAHDVQGGHAGDFDAGGRNGVQRQHVAKQVGGFEMREVRREESPVAVSAGGERREDEVGGQGVEGVSNLGGNVVGEEGGFFLREVVRDPARVPGFGP